MFTMCLSCILLRLYAKLINVNAVLDKDVGVKMTEHDSKEEIVLVEIMSLLSSQQIKALKDSQEDMQVHLVIYYYNNMNLSFLYTKFVITNVCFSLKFFLKVHTQRKALSTLFYIPMPVTERIESIT